MLGIEWPAISRRLKMNCALVPECRMLADIGCDHAYSSIVLAASGTARRCIAADVADGPLERARENIARFGLKDRIQVRRSDGLMQFAPGEADVIMISGMGGPLMMDILRKGIDCVRASKALVLQPQSELEWFRRELHQCSFVLRNEDMCCEDGKYYTAMYVENERGQQEFLQKQNTDLPEWVMAKYGPCLIQKKHPVLAEYIEKEIRKAEQLKQKLSGQETGRGKERLAVLREELDGLFALKDFLADRGKGK